MEEGQGPFGQTEDSKKDSDDSSFLSPDEICEEYQGKGVRITINQLDEVTLLVQGDKVSLSFLGELILSQAAFELDDGFQISPFGPGSKFFKDKDSLGLYISRVEREG